MEKYKIWTDAFQPLADKLGVPVETLVKEAFEQRGWDLPKPSTTPQREEFVPRRPLVPSFERTLSDIGQALGLIKRIPRLQGDTGKGTTTMVRTDYPPQGVGEPEVNIPTLPKWEGFPESQANYARPIQRRGSFPARLPTPPIGAEPPMPIPSTPTGITSPREPIPLIEEGVRPIQNLMDYSSVMGPMSEDRRSVVPPVSPPMSSDVIPMTETAPGRFEASPQAAPAPKPQPSTMPISNSMPQGSMAQHAQGRSFGQKIGRAHV